MYRRILVAIENSPADHAILDHVRQLAVLTGAELLLVHVADGWAARNFDQLNLRESEEMKEDRDYLARLSADLASHGIKVSTELAQGRSGNRADPPRRGARRRSPGDVHPRTPFPQRPRARDHRRTGCGISSRFRCCCSGPSSLTGLRSRIATPAGKRSYVRRLFATIADRYDVITVLLSYGRDRVWKTRLIALAAIAPDDRVLDLACGTGDILHAAASKARFGVGLDLTFRMLQLAAGKPSRPRAPLVAGDMLALPFGEARFTVVTVGYGLRNVPDIEQAIAEIERVLVPGGRLLSLDFDRPPARLVRTAYLLYLTIVGSALGALLHRDPDTYRYIPESIRNYPGAAGVARLLERQGFTGVRVVRLLGGLMAIHCARKAPGVPDARGGP